MERITLRKLAEILNLPNWAAVGIVLVPLLLVLSIVVALATGGTPTERVQMIYQLALVIAGLIGLPLAIWRTFTAHRQAQIGLKQLEGLQKQISLAEAGQEADRLQKGAELIQAEGMAVRTAGIAVLREIATTETHRYRREAVDVLVSFLQSQATADQANMEEWEDNLMRYGGLEDLNEPRKPQELRLVFEALVKIAASGIKVNFGEAYIRGITLDDFDLSGGGMQKLTFHGGRFHRCKINVINAPVTKYSRFENCNIDLADEYPIALMGNFAAAIFDGCKFTGKVWESDWELLRKTNCDIQDLLVVPNEPGDF